MAFAYCMARWPRPPPAPMIVTKSPGLLSVSFNALYDVKPAHNIAACRTVERGEEIKARFRKSVKDRMDVEKKKKQMDNEGR